jgi:hypothetical protein
MDPLTTLRPTKLLGNDCNISQGVKETHHVLQFFGSYNPLDYHEFRSPCCTERKHQVLAPPTYARKPGNRVHFSKLVEVQITSHVKNMSVDEIIATWWTQDDYMLIRRMVKITMMLLAQGGQLHPDDNDFCDRGLRYGTKADAEHRHRSKKSAINAVLRAQQCSQKENFRDHEYIKVCYLEQVKNSCVEARLLGVMDEAESKRVWKSAIAA